GRGAVRGRFQNVAGNDFEQAFRTGALQVDGLDVHHIPLDIAGFDLCLDFRHAARVILEQHLVARGFHVGIDLMHLLGGAVSASEGNNGEGLLGCRGNGCGQAGGQYRGAQRAELLHGDSPWTALGWGWKAKLCWTDQCRAVVCPSFSVGARSSFMVLTMTRVPSASSK